MNALTRKLARTIRSTKGQFLAVVAVVTLGIAVYISMGTAYLNLHQSQEAFYRENNFADYYFHVVRAPQQVVRQIEALPGVANATGRIQTDVPLLKADNQRATARLVSCPMPMETEVNRLHLLTGRLFDRYPQGGGVEVLIDPQYAAANSLGPGDTLNVVVGGQRVPLTVVGTATSPEFIYPIKDSATLMPEPETFGIIMLPHHQAQQLLNLSGQINQVVLQLAPGADGEQVAAAVKEILEPYGNLSSYPRDQQLSHAVMQAELDGLRASAIILPIVFLGIAAGIQFILLGRIVKAQRLQIGIMKALGYNNRQIMLHYTGYALAVAVVGAVLGSLLGLLVASGLSQLYAQFINLPETLSGVNLTAIAYGFLLSLGVGTLAGLIASRGVVGINPAESMRPEPPKSGRKALLERWSWLWARLNLTWRLGLRTISRNRTRFALTLVGVVFAVGMLVVAFSTNDSVGYMLQRHFYQDQDYDYLVHFTTPVHEREIASITRLDGVLRAEPLLQVPVRIQFAGRSEDEVLVGLPPDATMRTLVTKTGRTLPVPEAGMILNERTAAKLEVQVGDRVTVETLLEMGPSRYEDFTVIGINQQLVGSGAFVSLEQANRALQERNLVSGVMLQVDPGLAPAVEASLNDMTGVAAIMSRQKELDNITKVLDLMIYSVSIMIGFAVVLGFAIVYNTAVVSFSERRRELASLRVVGFTSGEVSGLLLKETVLQSAVGVVLGLPFGYLLARGIIAAQAQSTDLYTLPVVISLQTYLFAALGGILFILVAHRFAARGVARLDLVEVLKNRD